MERYRNFSARMIYALAPIGEPVANPGPTWMESSCRRRAVAYRIGGTAAEKAAADQAYRDALVAASRCSGIPVFLARAFAAYKAFVGRREFRWDPRGPLSWPEIYVAVEEFYKAHPGQDIWQRPETRRYARMRTPLPEIEIDEDKVITSKFSRPAVRVDPGAETTELVPIPPPVLDVRDGPELYPEDRPRHASVDSLEPMRPGPRG